VEYKEWQDEYPSEHKEWRDLILNEKLDDQFLWDNYVDISSAGLWNDIFEHQICSESFLEKWIELQANRKHVTLGEHGGPEDYLVRFQPLSETFIKRHMDYLDLYIEGFVEHQESLIASFDPDFTDILYQHVKEKQKKRAEIRESVKDKDLGNLF
jgi:hypothetical protein